MNKQAALISGFFLFFAIYLSSMPLPAEGRMVPVQEAGKQTDASPSLEVEHSIEGKSVQLYFSTKNFKLARKGTGGANRADEGHILLWVDGKMTKQFTKEVQVPLSSGQHKFAVQLARQDNTPYPDTRIEFDVSLP